MPDPDPVNTPTSPHFPASCNLRQDVGISWLARGWLPAWKSRGDAPATLVFVSPEGHIRSRKEQVLLHEERLALKRSPDLMLPDMDGYCQQHRSQLRSLDEQHLPDGTPLTCESPAVGTWPKVPGVSSFAARCFLGTAFKQLKITRQGGVVSIVPRPLTRRPTCAMR